jgi:hypothetical protein
LDVAFEQIVARDGHGNPLLDGRALNSPMFAGPDPNDSGSRNGSPRS